MIKEEENEKAVCEAKKVIKSKYSPIYQGSSFYWHMNTVRPNTGKVTQSIFPKGNKCYIGINLPLIKGDVIRIGSLTDLYRITTNKTIVDRSLLVYGIKRVDGNSITTFDINNTKRIGTVVYLSTTTSQEVLDGMNELHIENDNNTDTH